MTVDQLRARLETQYTLKSFIDLATLTHSPQAAYQFFDKHYQTEYQPNDRLVLYTSELVTSNLIAHLYRATNLIDVSNFFVLIVCATDSSKGIQDALRFSTDPVCFQTVTMDLVNTEPLSDQFVLSDTMCALPWMNLRVDTVGTVRSCCLNAAVLGSTEKDNLNDLFQSDQVQTLRQSMLAGQRPLSCNSCWNNENLGITSIRNFANTVFMKNLLTQYIDEPKIRSLDLNLDNTCNFKCRICNSDHSSLFAQEHSKHIGIKNNLQPASDYLIDQIKDLLPSLRNIEFYGGEPFLNKKIPELLAKAVETSACKNIRLHFNSNGSVYPKNLISYFSHFKEVDIHFSIDAVGSRFELERGGKWSDVEKNILSIQDLNLPNCKIRIFLSISAMNILYINEVLDWGNEHNIPVYPNYVKNPSIFALSSLTKEAKHLIINKHKNNPWPEMKNILTMLSKLPDDSGQGFVKLTTHFDSLRNQSFSDSHPEIANAMGYVYNKQL